MFDLRCCNETGTAVGLNSFNGRRIKRIMRPGGHEAMQLGRSLVAVSYTHLDVYKRQLSATVRFLKCNIEGPKTNKPP